MKDEYKTVIRWNEKEPPDFQIPTPSSLYFAATVDQKVTALI